MPTYYFHVEDDEITHDLEGSLLADDVAARAYAVDAARSLAADYVRNGFFPLYHRIVVENAARAPVAQVTFREAVEIIETKP